MGAGEECLGKASDVSFVSTFVAAAAGAVTVWGRVWIAWTAWARHGSRRRTRRSDPRGRRRTIAVLRLCETHASIFKRHARSYSCALALLTIAERRA